MKRVNRRIASFASFASFAAFAVGVPNIADAQSASLAFEYDKKVEAARQVGPLGEGMFGESTSVDNGRTTFSSVDIDLPGNNGLPVRFGRRLVIDERYLPEELGGLGNWDVDVPYIEGTFTQASGWTIGPPASSGRYARCSNPNPPFVEGVTFSAEEVWHGYSVYIPGAGSEQILKDVGGNIDPIDGRSYPWVMKSNGRISCLPALKNGYPGEGFLLHRPDGTKVYFDYQVERTVRPIQKGPSGYPGYTMTRKRIFLLATRMEDKHGNAVNYSYDSSGRLTSVEGTSRPGSPSDTRSITVSYLGPGEVRASSAGRHWTYTITSGHLTAVTLPDGSRWEYSPFGSLTAYVRPYDDQAMERLSYFDPTSMCQEGARMRLQPQTLIVKHPSGAVGSFSFSGRRFYRSRVPYYCSISFLDHTTRILSGFTNRRAQNVDWNSLVYTASTGGGLNYNLVLDDAVDSYSEPLNTEMPPLEAPNPHDGLLVNVGGYASIVHSNYYDVLSVDRIIVSGPGIQSQETKFEYDIEVYPYCGMIDSQTGLAFGASCSADPCNGMCEDAIGRWTTITLPTGERRQYRHGVAFGENEGQLLYEDVRNTSGALLRSVEYRFMTAAEAANQAFLPEVGQRLTADPMASSLRPLVQQDLWQQSSTFSYRVESCGQRLCFDAFARPTGVIRTTDLPVTFTSRAEGTEYHDRLDVWDLGQIARQTAAGIETTRTDFDTQGMPSRRYAFGELVETLSHHADGTIASAKDARNNTTTMSSWYRGVPRLVTFPDGTTVSATVDSFGGVTSVTNEAGATTAYAYDSMGRVSQISYPTADETSWDPTTFSFSQSTTSALGLPAGHWVHTTSVGDYRKEIYFDAFWRPAIQREWQEGSAATTMRYSGWKYDHAGRVTFSGYPLAMATSIGSFTAGTTTTYDALGRATRVEHDSELGDLVTTHEYLAGLKTRTTNPRGHSTLTAYRTFVHPESATPYNIQTGEQTTAIWLDMFDKPTAIIRSGNYDGQTITVSRYYVYDAQKRLCKRIEPESGAALFAYDTAGNIAWMAEGQTLTSLSCDRAAVPASEKTLRSYDVRNRLVLVDYPDSTPDVATTYTADGKVATVGRAPTLLSYTYNKRGLLSSERLQFGAINWLTSHSYTTLGYLGATTYPSGHQVAYAPNALGQATQAGTYATGAKYHPNGTLAEFTYGNGIVHTMSRNLRQLPERSRSALGANVVLDESYDYDANGNVAAISDALPGQPGNRDMSYDALDRLVGVAAGPAQGGNGSFAYDPLDNLRVLDQGGRQFRYHYGADNRLAHIKSPTGALLHSFGYDARGNSTSKDSGTLSFDRENRLTHSVLPTATTYVYDGLGRRVAEASPVSTYFYYSHEGKLLYSNDHKTQANTDHIYLAGSLVAARKVAFTGGAQVTYQHTDALGSPVAFTDASGNVARRERMTAWGEPADGTWSNEPGYTGHQMDAGSKLVYMQQRYYEPAIGRFLSVDPVAARHIGDNFNRYWYANNNPIINLDPDGRECNGYGCYVTPEERQAVEDGDWRRYYSLAASGGDPYARRAGDVAANTGSTWLEAHLSYITNLILASSIADGMGADLRSMSTEQTIALGYRMEAIRIALARAHVQALDDHDARPDNPVSLDRAVIGAFHRDVFKMYGANPDAFGGFKVDALERWLNKIRASTRETYDYCPPPSCKN